MRRFLAAAAAYPIGRPAHFDDYAQTLSDWTARAAAGGARLLVYPEYAAMELASLFGPDIEGDLRAQIDVISGLLPQVDALHAALAAQHGVFILAASAPLRRPDGAVVNRARFFGPDGGIGFQDKQIMTRFEREQWGVSGAAPLRVFDTPLGRIGVLICYDAEQPLLGRALAAAGAEIILAPSCTDALRGYSRVRIGAMARALEGQCVVLQSPTVGTAPWSPAVDDNVGAAAIYGPPDKGFPETGVIAEGALNEPGWVFGEIDRDAIAHVRADGSVLNLRHWPEQAERLMTPIESVHLE